MENCSARGTRSESPPSKLGGASVGVREDVEIDGNAVDAAGVVLAQNESRRRRRFPSSPPAWANRSTMVVRGSDRVAALRLHLADHRDKLGLRCSDLDSDTRVDKVAAVLQRLGNAGCGLSGVMPATGTAPTSGTLIVPQRDVARGIRLTGNLDTHPISDTKRYVPRRPRQPGLPTAVARAPIKSSRTTVMICCQHGNTLMTLTCPHG